MLRQTGTAVKTLHGYILRELLKTFSLTVLALTGLFTMAGGLLSIVRYEGITSSNLIEVMPWLLPVVVTLTMPIAALFAATMVFGRLSADNELNACKAAGINIHRLYLAPLLLALFIAALSVLSANFVIPASLRQIEQVARSNVRDFAFQQLRTRGGLRYRQEFFLTADRVLDVERRSLEARGFPTGRGHSYMMIESPTFLQLDESGRAVRFTTAALGLCQFDSTGPDVRVTIYVRDARDYQVGRSAIAIAQQRLGPVTLRRYKPPKPSLTDLPTLLDWYEAPWQIEKIRRLVDHYRRQLARESLLRTWQQRLAGGQAVRMTDERGIAFVLRAAAVHRNDKGLVLNDVRLEQRDPRLARPTVYLASRGLLEIRFRRERFAANVTLLATADQPVRIHHARAEDYVTPRLHDTQKLSDLRIDEPQVRQALSLEPRVLFDPRQKLVDDPDLEDQRRRLFGAALGARRDIAAVLHFRFGYALGALVTVLMGAILGTIYRGAQPLAAFGLSCVPFAVLTILTIMGRSLAEKPTGALVGPLIIWGGLVALAVADGLLLGRKVET